MSFGLQGSQWHDLDAFEDWRLPMNSASNLPALWHSSGAGRTALSQRTCGTAQRSEDVQNSLVEDDQEEPAADQPFLSNRLLVADAILDEGNHDYVIS
ncbi:MAG: hypothetical protein ACLVJ6_11505 [Merdibacter sp.]